MRLTGLDLADMEMSLPESCVIQPEPVCSLYDLTFPCAISRMVVGVRTDGFGLVNWEFC